MLCFLCPANYSVCVFIYAAPSKPMFVLENIFLSSFLFFVASFIRYFRKFGVLMNVVMWILFSFHLFNSISIFIHWSINEIHVSEVFFSVSFRFFLSLPNLFNLIMPHTEKLLLFWRKKKWILVFVMIISYNQFAINQEWLINKRCN